MITFRVSGIGYGVALVLAFISLAATGIVGIIGIPWFLAALVDGRWQGAAALAIWIALAAIQILLIRIAELQLKQSKVGFVISSLVVAMLPAVFLIWIISR